MSAMSGSPTGAITKLLNAVRSGDDDDRQELAAVVHAELRRIAGRMMSSERPGHTLQATVLADDAYMDLVEGDQNWQNRAHFFASAAKSSSEERQSPSPSKQKYSSP